MTTQNSIISAVQSAVVSMSSREIAELTGKRHSDVLRDIDRTIETLNADLRSGFKSSTYQDSTGRTLRQYILDRDSSYCLVAGYDVNARMRIIKRWQELEQQASISKFNIPKTYIETLRLAADLEEQRALAVEQLAKANATIDVLEPKAIGFDRIGACEDGTLCITDAAKTFGMHPKAFFTLLSQTSWIYRRRADQPWKCFQDKITAGWLISKLTNVEVNGKQTLMEQVRITPPGMTKIATSLFKDLMNVNCRND
jgi:phage regulator Rha-like protein